MSALEVFTYSDQTVRTVLIDGEPWFVAKDACEVVGISKHRDAVAQLDPDERASVAVDTLGGAQMMAAISESGLYALMLISRSPKARDFQRFVTHEILPTIRKTGSYSTTSALTNDQIVQQALTIMVARTSELEAKVAEDAPKVAYVEEFVDDDDVVLFQVAASELGMPVGELRIRLIDAGWIYKTCIGERWSQSKQRTEKEWEYRAASGHRDKFRSMPQHNAPRHHNGQVRTTLYVRSAALPAIRRRLERTLAAVGT